MIRLEDVISFSKYTCAKPIIQVLVTFQICVGVQTRTRNARHARLMSLLRV